jgi:hypothetical protein
VHCNTIPRPNGVDLWSDADDLTSSVRERHDRVRDAWIRAGRHRDVDVVEARGVHPDQRLSALRCGIRD